MRVLASAALGAEPAPAGVWIEIPSGTANTITAIEYQSATRFWFTTSAGEIYMRQGDVCSRGHARPAACR